MKLKKPKFWDYKKPNIISYILWPISFFLQIINILRNLSSSEKKFHKIKTICVGNIYIGGTGKTTLSKKIFEILQSKNIKSCFVKKYYKDQEDEQKILENTGKLFKLYERKQSLKKAINENFKVAIFDDGLQDKSIKYDLSFVCFNDLNFIGNGMTIPSGPLRENINNIRRFDYIFLNGNMKNNQNIKNEILKIHSAAKIFEARYIPTNLKEFDSKDKYFVFSGIGNHGTFISMLRENNLNVVKDIEFPDHYNYSQNDLSKIIKISKEKNLKILTTEKDFVRLKTNLDEIKFIKIKLEILNEENFLETLKIYE